MKKKDFFVIAALLLVGVIFLGIYLLQGIGKTAVITVDGLQYGTYSLNKNQTVTITGYRNGHNTLVIEDGKAFFTDCDCPDKLCENMGTIRYKGQSIICLPNKVVCEIRGGADREVDAVTGTGN